MLSPELGGQELLQTPQDDVDIFIEKNDPRVFEQQNRNEKWVCASVEDSDGEDQLGQHSVSW